MRDTKPTAAGKSSFALVDVPALFDELGLQPCTVLLDLACGAGAYALAAAQRIGPAGLVHAIDLWQEGIDLLNKRIQQLGLAHVQTQVADVSQRIPLADGSIDICLMATVLHDLVEDGTATGALRELRRVLKPQGMLGVVEFQKIDGPPGPPRSVRLTPEQVETLLRPHGLNHVSTRENGPYTYLSIYRGA